MTTRQTVETLLPEPEQLWLAVLEARRAAAAKEREYQAALLEWVETETKERKQNERQGDS